MKSIAQNYAATQLGPIREWARHSFRHAAFPQPVPGKAFIKEDLALSGMEISFNYVPKGGAIPFYHRHKSNEELYVFLSGRGELQVDDVTIPVAEGSAVRVSPAGKRAWRNIGEDALVFLCIQARAGALAQGDISDGEIVPGAVVWKQTAA